jgi:hypothetical protein
LDRQPLQAPHRLLGFSAYEWLVSAAGWAGWGFDVFDACSLASSRPIASRRFCTCRTVLRGTRRRGRLDGAMTAVLLLNCCSAGSAIA